MLQSFLSLKTVGDEIVSKIAWFLVILYLAQNCNFHIKLKYIPLLSANQIAEEWSTIQSGVWFEITSVKNFTTWSPISNLLGQ